jgi:hypothetical protein
VAHRPAEAADFGPDVQHHVAQGQARFGDAGREHPGEDGIRVGIVARQAVERALPRACREQDEGPLRRDLVAQSPVPAERPRALRLEGIVAAGVEDQEAQAHAPRVERGDDVADGNRLTAHDQFLPRTHERDVRRKQVVSSVDLHPVSGEEERDLVARVQPGGEGGKRRKHRAFVGVEDKFRPEPGPSEGLADRRCVVARALEVCELGVGVDADDEGMPFLRGGRVQGGQREDDKKAYPDGDHSEHGAKTPCRDHLATRMRDALRACNPVRPAGSRRRETGRGSRRDVPAAF